MQDWFIWNGVDSRTMGIVVSKPAPVVYPAERVEQVTVPGRRGFLTRTEGEGVFDGYLKTITIGNRRAADPHGIAAWLRGQGELILGNEPNRVYFGRIIKEASLERLMRDAYQGPISWMVQPEKGQYPPESATVWEPSGTGDVGSVTLYNPGDLPAAPRITVYATGLAGAGPMITLGIGDEALGDGSPARIQADLTARTAADGCVIDLDAMAVTTLDGAESLDASVTVYGAEDAIHLAPGEETVISIDRTTASVTRLSIEPRWRWL